MTRPSKNDYPVVYYDNGIKVALNPRHLPAYAEEWMSSRHFLDRSLIYRNAKKERANFKKYVQIIKDIIICHEEPQKKIDKIRKVLYVLGKEK